MAHQTYRMIDPKNAAIMEAVLNYCLENPNMIMYKSTPRYDSLSAPRQSREQKEVVVDGATFRYEILFGPTDVFCRDVFAKTGPRNGMNSYPSYPHQSTYNLEFLQRLLGPPGVTEKPPALTADQKLQFLMQIGKVLMMDEAFA